jgi:hypothetical protein
MTRAQAKLLAEFGPFELKGDRIIDVNGICMWSIWIQPPVMGVDRALVAALNHVVNEEKATLTWHRRATARRGTTCSPTCPTVAKRRANS